MGYVLNFSPWIAFFALSSIVNWRVGVVVALVTQALLALALIRRRQLDLLSIGTLVFFGAMSAVALASPNSSIHRWIPALSAGALAIISAVSLLAGQPFTLAIARRSTPEAVRSRPEFLELNRFLTSVWAASFTALAITCALLIGFVKNDAAPVVIANVVVLVIAFRITHRTVKKAEARAVAAGLM
jgi:hypothetical protein